MALLRSLRYNTKKQKNNQRKFQTFQLKILQLKIYIVMDQTFHKHN